MRPIDYYEAAYGDVYGEHSMNCALEATGSGPRTFINSANFRRSTTLRPSGKRMRESNPHSAETIVIKIEEDDGDTIVVSIPTRHENK